MPPGPGADPCRPGRTGRPHRRPRRRLDPRLRRPAGAPATRWLFGLTDAVPGCAVLLRMEWTVAGRRRRPDRPAADLGGLDRAGLAALRRWSGTPPARSTAPARSCCTYRRGTSRLGAGPAAGRLAALPAGGGRARAAVLPRSPAAAQRHRRHRRRHGLRRPRRDGRGGDARPLRGGAGPAVRRARRADGRRRRPAGGGGGRRRLLDALAGGRRDSPSPARRTGTSPWTAAGRRGRRSARRYASPTARCASTARCRRRGRRSGCPGTAPAVAGGATSPRSSAERPAGPGALRLHGRQPRGRHRRGGRGVGRRGGRSAGRWGCAPATGRSPPRTTSSWPGRRRRRRCGCAACRPARTPAGGPAAGGAGALGEQSHAEDHSARFAALLPRDETLERIRAELETRRCIGAQIAGRASLLPGGDGGGAARAARARTTADGAARTGADGALPLPQSPRRRAGRRRLALRPPHPVRRGVRGPAAGRAGWSSSRTYGSSARTRVPVSGVSRCSVWSWRPNALAFSYGHQVRVIGRGGTGS